MISRNGFTVCEDFSDRVPAHDNRKFWIENCGWHLHSNGKVYLRAPEFFPTRKDAEEVLVVFPNPQIPKPAREWKSGDVFQYPPEDETRPMIFIKNVSGKARNERCVGHVFCLNEAGCDMEHNTNDFLRGAEFLFNINDRMEADAEAAEPKCDRCGDCRGAGTERLWCAKTGLKIKDGDELKPQCENGSARK